MRVSGLVEKLSSATHILCVCASQVPFSVGNHDIYNLVCHKFATMRVFPCKYILYQYNVWSQWENDRIAKKTQKKERKEQQRTYTTHDTYHLEPLKPSFTEHSNAISERRTKYIEVFVPLVMVKGRSFTHSKSIPSSGHKFVS